MTEKANGFNCETCEKWHVYPLYVYAHTQDRLTHTCDGCGAKHSIFNLKARQTKSGKKRKAA